MLDQLALEYICEYCGVRAGVWCVTKRNKRAYWLHSARQNPIRLAWLDGYGKGYADCQAFTKDRLDRIA